jgi:hypothetical protein
LIESNGTDREVPNAAKLTVECHGDDGWQHRPTRHHPALIARYAGYLTHGYTFHFSLDASPNLLDDHVDSACWDSLGNLVYARDGVLYRYALADLNSGRPTRVIDLEALAEG